MNEHSYSSHSYKIKDAGKIIVYLSIFLGKIQRKF